MFELNKLIRSNILELKPYSSARDEFSGAEGIFLDANENPYGTLNRYPDPYQKELKRKISKLKDIDSANIFLGNGSDEIIDLCFRIFCEPGKSKVLSFTPTYGMYEVSANINDVKMVKLPLDTNFQIDEKAIRPVFKDDDIKMIFICSPNNPTGNLINTKTIEFILKQFKGIVVIDEAYIDFAESSSWNSRLSEFPNLIVTQTFSKAWGLAGARIGMAFASSSIITFLNKVKPPYNVSSLNQQQVINQIGDKEKTDLILKELLAERKKLIDELQKINGINKIYPTDANFTLLEVENTDTVYQQLLRKKIIVRNRNSVVRGCLRITVGNPAENRKLIKELKNILS